MAVIVLHTTEGGTLKSNADYLRSKHFESHWLYDPAIDEEIQLLDLSQTAKALFNERGGVETNKRGGVYQVELIGWAAEVPTYDTRWYANLKRWLQQKCLVTGTPYAFPCAFMAYPDSFGNNGVRLSPEQWLTVEGIIGHMHVPENVHGDPGLLLVNLLQEVSVPEEPCLTKTTQVVVSGQSYNLVDVLGWTLEGINAIRAWATTGDVSHVQITPEMIADELAKRLSS